MNVLILEPYYVGSHQIWADGYLRHSRHSVRLLTLPAQYWKWRMQGGAVTMARLMDGIKPDVILASSMIDLSIFRALTYRTLGNVPIAMYFHENQLSYPQNKRQGHGFRYGFINYISALVADANFFNSDYHRADFLDQLPRLLKHFADFNELETVDTIREKSSVLPVGIDFARYRQFRPDKPVDNPHPLVLWNHRWEDDKNPDEFINAMIELDEWGVDFRLAITGENFQQIPKTLQYARDRLAPKMIQFGYLESFADYARLLWQADYVVSTAYQDFFGISVSEAIFCGSIPILPNRLNYPYLIPAEFHPYCLYDAPKLADLLRQHLDGEVEIDSQALQSKIAQFDWTILAQQYDHALENLVIRRP